MFLYHNNQDQYQKQNQCQYSILSLFFKRNTGHELPTNLLRIFKEGNAIHEKWQNLFVEQGIAKAIEITHFNEKYDLSYTPDAEVEMLGEDVVIEIKSMNSFAFQKAKGHPSGEKQLNFYLWLRRKKWGFVLAEDKNNQNIKVFIVKYDKEKVKPYVMRLKKIQKYKQFFVESGKLPKKKCRNCDTKRAQECGLRDACWEIGKGRKKLTTKVRNDGKKIKNKRLDK